jgi:hypothetical protein
LIELLIVILIISILAALVLGVAAVASETSRAAKSRDNVTRLHTLLVGHYDTYKNRRVKVRQPVIDGINSEAASKNWSLAQTGLVNATARLFALRELMIMEVPDRWSDVLLRDVPASPSGVNDALYPFYLDSSGAAVAGNGRTSLANVYLRRYASIATGINSLTGLPNTGEQITENQGAECLYMVITQACGDGEARALFAESSIGDTDGDGAPEFLDGWGHPVSFLRWAPGFDSQIQLNANNFLPLPINSAWKKAALVGHDPFDVFRVDAPAFRLVPLICSAGRDEAIGIRLGNSHVALRGLQQSELADVPASIDNWRAILPWATAEESDGTRLFLGSDSGESASKDNIHNHLVGLR